jgi:hypothetical protein
MVRIILEPKGEEVTGRWRKLHNGEFHNFHFSPSIIRVVKSRSTGLAELVTRMGEMKNAYRIFVGKPKVMRPLGRPKRRWKGNDKFVLDSYGLDSSGSSRGQWRTFVNTLMNLRFPKIVEEFWHQVNDYQLQKKSLVPYSYCYIDVWGWLPCARNFWPLSLNL